MRFLRFITFTRKPAIVLYIFTIWSLLYWSLILLIYTLLGFVTFYSPYKIYKSIDITLIGKYVNKTIQIHLQEGQIYGN